MTVEIVYMRRELIPAWRAAVEAVAAERKYLARITLPTFDPENNFATRMIDNGWPMYCALGDGELVGWADITPVDIPECSHRGTLGMGVIAPYRSRGIGSRLLAACLAHSPQSKVSKVELSVYTSNTPAIALYRKFQFTETGVIRDYRRLDGVAYDSLFMECFLC